MDHDKYASYHHATSRGIKMEIKRSVPLGNIRKSNSELIKLLVKPAFEMLFILNSLLRSYFQLQHATKLCEGI